MWRSITYGISFWFNRVIDGDIDDVTAQDYNSCNISSPLTYYFGYGGYTVAVGPFPVTETYPMSYHFVEDDTASCTAGMKFDALVYDPSSVPPPSPSSSPTPSVNASTTPPPLPLPMPPVSPPGPLSPAAPPLAGEAVPTPGNSTRSKISAGAIAGIAVAGIVAALGGGAIALKNKHGIALLPCLQFQLP